MCRSGSRLGLHLWLMGDNTPLSIHMFAMSAQLTLPCISCVCVILVMSGVFGKFIQSSHASKMPQTQQQACHMIVLLFTHHRRSCMTVTPSSRQTQLLGLCITDTTHHLCQLCKDQVVVNMLVMYNASNLFCTGLFSSLVVPLEGM